MFIRVKKNGAQEYLQLVSSERIDGKVRQRVIGSLGRRDLLEDGDALGGLAASLAKYSRHAAILTDHRSGNTEELGRRSLGPGLVFQKLWEQIGVPQALWELLADRKFSFAVERAIFLTVLHRLMAPASGTSDRAAEKWREGYIVQGVEGLDLQHLYRAMAWLGEELDKSRQADATPFSPRCTKDLIEEALFSRRRNLFTGLTLAFFDTTSLYFEGEGGETLGKRGHNKDHRPDLKQMVVGVVLSGEGRPVCSEMWPGNTTDVKTLLPVVTRLRKRFGITNVCVVSDRGMISRETIAELEDKHPDLKYILGARMRADHEVRDKVLSWPGSYHEVHGEREHGKDPSPLKVKDIRFTGDDDRDRRYVVCHNEEQARKDRKDREAIVAALEDQLKRGDKSLVGNKGYRKFIQSDGRHFSIDRQKVRAEERLDGKWVLRTNWWEASSAEVALRYKELWMVEAIFRTMKSALETRPIYHKCDETIRGHVFCSFLALLLRKELQERLAAAGGVQPEWADVLRDLDALGVSTLRAGAAVCELRSMPRGVAGKVLPAVGVALGPTLRFLSEREAAAWEGEV